jgi:hypothetical protein
MLPDDRRYEGKVVFSSIYVSIRESQNVLAKILFGAIDVHLFSIP